MNYDKVTPRLWQGAIPVEGGTLAGLGVHVLVLAAHEYQPDERRFPGVQVLHCPLHDQPDQSLEDLARIILTAHEVAEHLKRGATVLSTCHMGLNRSGVISGLALCELGVMPKIAVGAVRKARGKYALSNPTFEKVVLSYPR